MSKKQRRYLGDGLQAAPEMVQKRPECMHLNIIRSTETSVSATVNETLSPWPAYMKCLQCGQEWRYGNQIERTP